METVGLLPGSSCPLYYNHLRLPTRTQITPKSQLNSLQNGAFPHEGRKGEPEAAITTMSEILNSSRAHNLDLLLQTLGPLFRITAKSLETQNELGKTKGLIRVWLRGRILHLESTRLKRETLSMEKLIFGIGLFIGDVAVRYGYDCYCRTVELLAIDDSDPYHFKFCRKYAAKRKAVGICGCKECGKAKVGGAYTLNTASVVTLRSTIRRLREQTQS